MSEKCPMPVEGGVCGGKLETCSDTIPGTLCEECGTAAPLEVFAALSAQREKLTAMHRRAQTAEAALPEWKKVQAEVTSNQRTGRFYPAMMASSMARAAEENAALREKLEREKVRADRAEASCREMGALLLDVQHEYSEVSGGSDWFARRDAALSGANPHADRVAELEADNAALCAEIIEKRSQVAAMLEERAIVFKEPNGDFHFTDVARFREAKIAEAIEKIGWLRPERAAQLEAEVARLEAERERMGDAAIMASGLNADELADMTTIDIVKLVGDAGDHAGMMAGEQATELALMRPVVEAAVARAEAIKNEFEIKEDDRSGYELRRAAEDGRMHAAKLFDSAVATYIETNPGGAHEVANAEDAD